MNVRKTIFIVDDDEDDRLFIKEAISDNAQDVELIEIPSGEEMYVWMAKGCPDQSSCVILMDMNMPRLNGLEVLSVIKRDTEWKHVPVVMVSTTSNPDLVNTAYDLGVNAFITKPVTPKDYDVLAQALNLCFLNHCPENTLWVTGKSRIKSLIVIEDNDDHWELVDLALKGAVADLQTTRLKDRVSSMDFFENKYLTLPVPPDFILLDLYLPEREDGLALLNAIRMLISKHKLVSTPVIVFSYSNYPGDATASLSGQANAYLVKPLNGREWPSYFRNLCYVMSNTIKLPKAN